MIGALRHRRLVALVFWLALGIAVVFAGRLVILTIHWSDPAHLRAPPAAWMTPGYLVRSWHLDPDRLAAHLGLAPGSARGMTLADLARARGIPTEQFLADLAAALPGLAAQP